MPRQSTRRHLEVRRWVAKLWTERPSILGALSHQDQRYLHDYFLPSVIVSDEQLLAYRAKISKDRPSLPQCAGRAVKRLEALVAMPARVPVAASWSRTKQRGTPAVTAATVKPQIDIESMARALVWAAEGLAKQDRESRDHDSSAAA